MAPKKQNETTESQELMIVNDSPGEECRIAILNNGHLEELFTERTSTATNVGNIYKGRVVNVEPAIQAAFIDYGEGINGFLHISDLHPKYFPGEERTERVGKKIPRRERPPIQHALKRGQEILVQVLKEGLGTKGPTLTSYLSIPGRLLVLMPDMDRVGVSRKVEDEEQRREMRQILDSLGLPDGFGFILRTAGYGKTKTELKRDAAYLMRLWKVMEKRIKTVGAPCELYTESDLFIRTVRDVLRPSIGAIIVDSDSAYDRASMFLRVIAPRSTVKVIRYRRAAPIFHAFDIERQIELIHAREVPLPSGGRLVLDQTEALVAIDVNSGRSRSARDSETNAYETNCEAADEICRQLRLRDLGGLIVNDLIDMRSIKHRKQIEERFQNLLKRDRAKSTVLPISDFGIMEMTRQRMRPSIRKSHFMDCPHCNGHGEIKSPDYVAADAARHIGFLLQYDRVARVEIACSPRVASVLLSAKRRELVRLEDIAGKRVDVRVSDAIAVDRVDYYAYDDRNADIDIAQLPPLKPPPFEELEAESSASVEAALDGEEEIVQERGRRRKAGPADATAIALAGDFAEGLDEFEDEEVEEPATQPPAAHDEAAEPRHGRRRRRRGRGRRDEEHAPPLPLRVHEDSSEADGEVAAAPASAINGQMPQEPPQDGKRSRRRRGRRGRRGERDSQPIPPSPQPISSDQPPGEIVTPEPSVRIHELARELSVTTREVIERSETDPAIHHLANALSTVSAEEAEAIRQLFGDDQAPAEGQPATAEDFDATKPPHAQPGEGRRRRRRRGRRGRGMRPDHGAAPMQPIATVTEPTPASRAHESEGQVVPIAPPGQAAAMPQHGRKKRRRRGRRGGGAGGAESAGPYDGTVMSQTGPSLAAQETRIHQPSPAATPAAPAATSAAASPAPAKKRRRALYRAGRVSVSPLARESATPDE